MSESGRRFLIVSFHDLTPETKDECDVFIDLMARLGVGRTSLLTVPSPNKGRPVNNETEFLSWLHSKQDEGHEVCLHGYSHHADSLPSAGIPRLMGQFYTDREGEFQSLTEQEAHRRIQAGAAALCDAGFNVSGFIPPAWLINSRGLAAVARSRLRYIVHWGSISLLPENKRITAPVLVYSTRRRWRRIVSVYWCALWHAVNRKQKILRIAVHPPDLRYSRIRESICLHVKKALMDREPTTYRDLVDALR
jgi:predicted deacetylase